MLKSGGITDVTVGGASVVADGVANIPFVNKPNFYGVIKVANGYGLNINAGGMIFISDGTVSEIKARQPHIPITAANAEVMIKTMLCDGKGAAWTNTERQAALARMGCTVGDDGTVKFTAQET